jgi:hypothetical protein
LHGLAAVLLLGAISHQTIGVCAPRIPQDYGFLRRLTKVHGASYTNAVIVLYLIVIVGGGIIYPSYVLDVKGSLNDARMLSAIGAFEIKEHLAVVGLALLPTYWYFWRDSVPVNTLSRRLNTAVVCGIVWWSFLIGHILNNIKGLL